MNILSNIADTCLTGLHTIRLIRWDNERKLELNSFWNLSKGEKVRGFVKWIRTDKNHGSEYNFSTISRRQVVTTALTIGFACKIKASLALAASLTSPLLGASSSVILGKMLGYLAIAGQYGMLATMATSLAYGFALVLAGFIALKAVKLLIRIVEKGLWKITHYFPFRDSRISKVFISGIEIVIGILVLSGCIPEIVTLTRNNIGREFQRGYFYIIVSAILIDIDF